QDLRAGEARLRMVRSVQRQQEVVIMKSWIKHSGATFAAVLAAAVALPSHASTLPHQRHGDAAVSYISGGIGEGQATRLERQAHAYPLTVELLEHAKARDEYTSDAVVRISDARSGHVVLDAKASGPFMLVRLPAGDYRVGAMLNGHDLPEHHVHVTDD